MTDGPDGRTLRSGEYDLERVTLRVPETHVEIIEEIVELGEFPNRSEAIRAFIRDGLKEYAPPSVDDDQLWEEAAKW